MAKQPLIPPIGEKVNLKDYDPGYTGNFESKEDVEMLVTEHLLELRDLQRILYAESKRSILVVLQAMDTGGKDGTIRHVFSGVNPQGVNVTSFKAPTPQEAAHDFMWRIHEAAPARGYIQIFNRSHYEDVLVVRVHDIVPKKVWKERYDQINEFEQLLIENDTVVLKFFLHISKDEQKKRLESRIKNPKKQWKFNSDDLKERELWDVYMDAYEDALTKCNTEDAPWHIVPANKKWYRNYVVTETIVSALRKLDLEYPKPEADLEGIVIPD
jgi:PPK2 family polyphosphate:nucleotide phosphotransferase